MPDRLYRHLGALTEPARVRLLWVLEREELGVGELCRIVQQPQSTVSRHLKALQVGGWVRRRSEGTSGLFRMDELDRVAARVWEVVREEHAGTRQAEEDAARLATVLEARRLEGSGFFGRFSAEWDAIRAELFGDDFLIEALAALLPRQWVVADLGCGTGQAIAVLAPNVARVIGVDREQAMLAAAGERLASHPNVSLRRGELEALPLDDGEVDVALLSLVLHHVEDPGRVFAEVRRVVRPDGRVVVVDMAAHDRAEYRWTMGHRHSGFSADSLASFAQEGGLVVDRWRALVPAAEAAGPPLFLATLANR
jgi:ArsR family transcriptional regulator